MRYSVHKLSSPSRICRVTTAAPLCSGHISCKWNRVQERVKALMSIRCLDAMADSGWWPPGNWHHVRLSSAAVERPNLIGVKGTVNRARAILVCLFPALWLVASANCLVDPVSVCAGNGLASSVSGRGHGRHDPSNAVSSLERSARRWSRRLNVQSGPDGFPTPAMLSQLRLPELEPVEACSVGSQSSLGLAKCWQFLWRTALEPRAPSSVS
jgi:hypothetical protein